jgi:hypothetical protein
VGRSGWVGGRLGLAGRLAALPSLFFYLKPFLFYYFPILIKTIFK